MKKLQRMLACLLAALMLLSQVGTLTPAAFAAEDAEPVLQGGSAVIPSNAGTDQVNEILAKALIANYDQVDPAKLASLEWEYECEGSSSLGAKNNAWGSISGFTTNKKVALITTTFNHPALAKNADGDYKVRLAGTDNAVTLHKVAKLTGVLNLNEGASVKIEYNDDLSINFDKLYADVWNAVYASSTPDLSNENVVIKYYATSDIKTHAWVKLEGDKVIGVTYPAITEGVQKIQISWGGNDEYYGLSAETEVTFLGREAAPLQLTDVREVALVYANDDLDIDYVATEQAIRDALLVSTDESVVSVNDVTIEYKFANNYKPINENFEGLGLTAKSFGLGEQTLRFSWGGTTEYKDWSAEVKVNVTDSRTPTEIVLKEGAHITYNKDPQVMKQAIFDSVIDWDNSTLPAKDTLSVDDLTFKYCADPDSTVKIWHPIEGGSTALVPRMEAGENQLISVSYAGNKDFRPADAEGTLTVDKANVKVTVKSTSIYPDEKPGADFVTTDPVDNFDIYIIYAGINSNIKGGIYVQLPERFTDNGFIKMIDGILDLAGQKTLTQIMEEGTTLGELKNILSKVPNDSIQQLVDVLNALPGITDDTKVAFGSPKEAGIYTVTAKAVNKNYNTGTGTGVLIVKIRVIGVKLVWKETIPGGKLTVDEAAAFDFGATVTYNGEDAPDQSNVRLRFTGITSSGKPYVSSNAPTEPGRYVVTASTFGGNFNALLPITRSFQIIK